MTDREDLQDPTLPSTGAGSEVPPARGHDVLPRGTSIGRYVVLNRLGSGAMGVVYGAYDPELDRKVALKLMAPYLRESERSEEFERRLLREAQAMARLSHPNVITVYDTGTFQSQVFVAMELVDGCTLRKWLRQQPRSWQEILGVLVQAGRGLAAAHSAGLVHRDFKPDNVLVGNDGRVHVTDFGIARSTLLGGGGPEGAIPSLPDAGKAHEGTGSLDIPLTEAGAVVGTPGYMSPEQISSGGLDARSDEFCFCIVLYESLYGERPFKGKNLLQMSEEMARGAIPEPPAGTSVPGEVRRILLKGLSYSAGDRYPSMDALLDALSRVRDPRQVSRWRIQAGLALVLVAALSAGAAYLSARQTRVCAFGGEQLAGTWDEPRKQAIHAAFLATRTPYAEDAWKTVERVLDGYAAAWLSQRTEACLATRVRHEWPADIMNLRLLCLERQRKQLETLTRVYATADVPAVESAVSAVNELPDARACGDVLALTSRIKPPDTPALRAKVDAVRTQLAEATALMSSGQEPKAFEIAKAAAQAADELHYPPLLAEALTLRGRLEATHKGDYKAAEQTLYQAIWAAEAGQHDEAAARAWTQMVQLVGEKLSRPDEGLQCSRHADALLAATGGDDRLRIELLSHQGAVLTTQGRHPEALEYFQKALALAEKVYPGDHPTLAAALSNVGWALYDRGDYEQDLTQQRRALAILEKAFGKAHPRLVMVLSRIGDALDQQGKNAEATEYQRRSLEILRGALGPEHPRVANAMAGLGIALYTQEHYDEALKLLLGALEIQEKVLGQSNLRVASTLTAIGECLVRQERYQDAQAYLQRALDITEKGVGKDNVRAAPILSLLGYVERGRKHHAQALAYFQKVLDIRTRAVGSDSPTLATDLTRSGELYMILGQWNRATPTLEHALALRQRENGSPDDLGDTQFALAQALWRAKPSRQRARELAIQARDNLAKAGSSGDAARKQVESWLAAHSRP